MSFETLLSDLEALRKSQAIDDGEGDDKIKAAAAEDGEGGEADPAIAGEGEGEGDPLLGKSMTVIGEDGEPMEAIDGTEMIKSLVASVGAIKAEREVEHGHLSKALASMTDLLGEQGKMIKSLQEQVSRLSGQGRGRISTVAPDETFVKSAAAAAAAAAQASPEQLLAKCSDALAAGKLTGFDISVAESCVNRGIPLPERIVAALS